MKKMVSKYRGSCRKCKRVIATGMTIWWAQGQGAICNDCHEKPKQPKVEHPDLFIKNIPQKKPEPVSVQARRQWYKEDHDFTWQTCARGELLAILEALEGKPAIF